MPKKKDNSKQYIRAQFVPDTMDAEKRTVEVTFATDTPVLRYSWRFEEYFFEVLDMKGAKLDRAKNGLPVLDNHGTWGSVGDILGRAENVRIEGGVGRATVRFSKRDNIQDIVSDVQDGIIKDISFGYNVSKLERQEKVEGETYRQYIAREWEPTEISFVIIPADPKAGVRSSDENEQEPEYSEVSSKQNKQIMKREQIIALLEKRGITVAETATDAELAQMLERAMEVKPAAPAPTNEPVDNEAVRAAALKAERDRVKEINTIVRKANLKDAEEFIAKHTGEGTALEEVRRLVLERFVSDDPNAGQRNVSAAQVGADREAGLRREAIEASLVMRVQPELAKEYSEDVKKEARRYAHHTLIDIARGELERGQVDMTGMSAMEIAKRSITSNTSDFPILLEGTNRRILLANYNAAADTWREFCSIGSVSDFREYKRLRMGTFNDLDALQENGEYKNKPISDADYEKVSVVTKGNIINVSRQMIVNDDLASFTRLVQMLGRAAARSIENDVFALLKLNGGLGPNLVDGKTLFHADHGNIATTAGAPTVAILEAMRVQMASQKDKDENDFLDIRPSLALAPLGLGSTLRVLNQSQYNPDETGKYAKPNVVVGLLSKVIDTPRLTGAPFYLFANPADEPVLEVSFLNGQQTPYMESEQGFEVDGLRWKIRMDYGVGAVGFRGAIRNAGA